MSEAALRADIPPHFSKESPCWGIFEELRRIHARLDDIARAKTHTVCVRARDCGTGGTAATAARGAARGARAAW